MAGKTFPLGCDHFMGNSNRRILVSMTTEAEFPAFLGTQGRVLRGMGIMTGATLSLLKGHVFNITTSLEICCFMALVTKLAPFLRGFEGFLRCIRVVAFFATNFDYKGMRACSQEVGLF